VSHTHPIVHFEILGRDQKLLEEFYQSIFHWEIDPVEDWYSVVNSGAGIHGGIGARKQYGGHVTFYVAVEDGVASLQRIESKGGKTAFGHIRFLTAASSPAFLIPRAT